MSLSFLEPGNAPDLVYREAPHMESLVFTSPEDAMFLDQIHEAIGAGTWTEFEYLMPDAELAELIERHNEGCGYEETFLIPRPTERFEFSQLCAAHMDGDYPDWYQKMQEVWLPSDFLERWGRLETTVLNGDFWNIDPANEREILVDLSERGLKVEKREDLYFY